ncbi:HORMA domain-containing protein 1 isoform X1 [Brachyistius frenatus]|uniref:HORMA domain-containing protein 1 isoform X1 n=1 Tax=Brachyistius frenatus TaxID=100188 RepID=UPI0037E82176
MACLQQVRSSQEAQLSPNQVVTEQQSLVVVKKLLAIAVSGITYLRGIFPGKAYGSKYVEDQQVMILKEDHNCPGSIQILKWMQGCFDAIEKKYLRIVIMSIYTDPENPLKVTECYQFKIQYTAKGARMDFESNKSKVSSMSCGNTKKASILLVRKLYTLMQNLGPLPENVCLNMKLAYYDDVTPQGYQPPGFKEAEGDPMEFEQEPVKLTMGEVVTPFHSLKLDMTTERRRLEQAEESVRVTEKWVMKVEGEEEEEEEGVLTQSPAPGDAGEPDKEDKDPENTEIQMSVNEKIKTREEVTEIETMVTSTANMELDLKRTRSGRIIKSTTETNLTVNNNKKKKKEKMVSQYDFPNSQETPSNSATNRKRKLSEPKERF